MNSRQQTHNYHAELDARTLMWYIWDGRTRLDKSYTTEYQAKQAIRGMRHQPTFGPQEPPQDDYRIFNKRQADGSYRPLSEFFDGVSA